MDRRQQVFVSSTFVDLQEERAAIVSALLSLEAFPAGMELFPAADDDAWTLIKKVIDESDYYLLVIGGKYGSIDPETKLSYTEKEYDYAVAQKKPVMAFLHAKPQKIELGKSEASEETRAKLAAFRKKVESAKHVKYWKSRDDLRAQVALSFPTFRQQYPAVGWIRGDVQTSTETLGELNELRKEKEDLERQLEAARTKAPAGSEDLAQGDDLVGLSPVANVEVALNGRSWRTTRYRLDVSPPFTWDGVFSSLGPDLLDEADERDMFRAVSSWLTSRFGDAVRSAAEEGLELKKRTKDTVQSVSLQLQDVDFGTVMIQLNALGLITRSEKKRSVSDTGTYWTLTPFGTEHLTTLRAVRRGDTEAAKTETESQEASDFSLEPINFPDPPDSEEDDIPF
jgi:uncharacterized protein DUF4062